MSRVLVHYATTHGHTEKIAAALAEAVAAQGIEVTRGRADDGQDPDPADFDGGIVAGSLHAGKHQSELADSVKARRHGFAGVPTLFVSVSLTAAEDAAEAHDATQRCIDEFVADTGCTPAETVAVAAALQYREYDVSTRTLMRLTMRRGGHTKDTARDHDYTDWDGVARIGRDFASRLGARVR